MKTPHNIVDLLCTFPSTVDFSARVQRLQLSPKLEEKVLQCNEHTKSSRNLTEFHFTLEREDEEALATQVLLYNHRFTECVLGSSEFRQAALTVIQNIYLFRNRHIFFQPPTDNGAEERILALQLFSNAPREELPIAWSLCHAVLARIWSRIVSTADDENFRQPSFLQLHGIVENLNTLRNIYMLFSSRLLRKLAGTVSSVYRQSLPYEDRIQAGSFGIARAAYRYHPSIGIRFSTYATGWFYKEIQRQALEGRLVRISSNMVEQYARIKKQSSQDDPGEQLPVLSDAVTPVDEDLSRTCCFETGVDHTQGIEDQEQIDILLRAINHELPPRNADIIRRRYGLHPYHNRPQSVMEIAELYAMTRGRVYQIEQEVLGHLRKNLFSRNSYCTEKQEITSRLSSQEYA